jgi:hypothetical protein
VKSHVKNEFFSGTVHNKGILRKECLLLPHDSFDDLIRRYRQELMRYRSQNPAVPDSPPPERAPSPSPAPPPPPPAPVPVPPVPPVPPDAPAEQSGSPQLPLLEELMQCRDGYTHSGTLQVAVTTAREAVPLQGADVTIYCLQDGRRRLKYFLTTNESGRTPAVLLPAPPPVNSGTPGNRFPYAVYGVAVHKPGFLPEREEQVRVFADISGIASFDLIPGDLPPRPVMEGG